MTNVLKPFENLKVLELQQEVQARGIWDCDKGRKELQDTLADVLKGAQRVPSLLVTDPEQPLKLSVCIRSILRTKKGCFSR